MSGKRGGLGRGISSLIPTSTEQRISHTKDETHAKRPVDVFFDGAPSRGAADGASDTAAAAAPATSTEKQTATGRGKTKRAAMPGLGLSGSRAATRQSTQAAGPTSDAAVAAESPAGASAEVAVAAGAALRGDTVSETGALTEVPGLRLLEIDPAEVVPNPAQPRKEFDEEALNELIHSVKEFGVLQPIVVRSRAEGGYELIMGERRLRASKAAGLTAIPAILRETADEDLLRDALLENLHRSNLNPLEEASAYQQLLQDFGITQDELATRIGRSRPQVSNTLRLLKLPTSVQSKVASGVLSAGHARALLSLSGTHDIEKAADKVINQGLSVRQTEELGATSASKKRPVARAGRVQEQLGEVAERLEDALDTRVRISLTRKKGQVVIDFATIADLNRIVGQMGVKGFGE